MIQKPIFKNKEFLTLISGGLLVRSLISYLQFSNESLKLWVKSINESMKAISQVSYNSFIFFKIK